MKFEIYKKGTNELIDVVTVDSEEELSEDYDYSTDFFDIKRVA